MTWEEFLDLPEDQLKHAELVDGEVHVNPPTPQHQRVVVRLIAAFDEWVTAGAGRGEVTLEAFVRAAEDRGYQADVAWFPEERCAGPNEPAAFTGVPALIVEVLSSSTRNRDLVRKRADYAHLGVDELWLVDPDEGTAFTLRRHHDAHEFELAAELGPDDELSSPLLSGFAVSLGTLLRR